MKKFLIAIAVAAVAATGLFAQNVSDALNAVGAATEAAGVSESLQGTWYDKKYDCNWVFSLNSNATALCELRDAPTNELIYKFTKNNVQNYKQSMDVTNGLTIEFECAETNRKYKFVKPISGSPDLNMYVYNTAYDEKHEPTIVYNGYNVSHDIKN